MRLLICLLLMAGAAHAQINPAAVTIARDSFGVPHVFAKTDAEVAYGLAFAHAEDDFESLQLLMLPVKGMLGKHLGRAGAQVDYVAQLLDLDKVVEGQWGSLSVEYKQLMAGYVQGMNDYATKHPEEVLVKKLFPITEKNYSAAVVLALTVFNGADRELQRIFGGRMPTVADWEIKGSNAIAVHPSKTTTGEAFLAINAHQPNSGTQAFYEAHLCSEQGWNALGGLLPGGMVILHGANEHLGWAHTVNNPDKADVYQLQMNPDNANQYKFDGQWIDLDVKTVKLKVKGVPITVRKKAYYSKYGPTVKTKQGVFSLRMASLMKLGPMEQWYRMNKAKSYTEFRQVLGMQQLSMFNIMYADRHDTIFYVSNVTMPDRNVGPAYNWRGTLPGNTSKTLWTAIKPFEQLPQYINPAGGFLFNTNHSPFMATAPQAYLNPKLFDPKDGFETFDVNRSARFKELMPLDKPISYEEFKAIKHDHQLPKKLLYSYNIDTLYTLKPTDYPQMETVIRDFQSWDKNAVPDSRGGGAFLMAFYYLADSGKGQYQVTKAMAEKAFAHVQAHQIKHFGKTGVTLGEYQRLIRGNKSLPVWGMPDVLTAMWATATADGRRRVVGGDGYVAFVRFGKTGLPQIESINCYGASAKPSSKHYADQMERFIAQQPKRMTLDKAEVLRTAERVYHPGE
ncbi:MAG: acylase [Bacteroidetes bacterium]|nr:MAG: acylase [Bacteroidota bacterium]